MSSTRQALVQGASDRIDAIRRFLPSNYTAEAVGLDVLITGEDVAGWTLDGYVIPRLASGLYRADEVSVQNWTITINLKVAVDPSTSPAIVSEALDNLADIMFVQAEDGLYRLGNPDADDLWVEGAGDAPGYTIENSFLGDFLAEAAPVTVKRVDR